MLTAEQQKTRSTGIGGSETPAIVGLDPYNSALDIWERKTGARNDDGGDTHHTERGNFLEPGLRAWASSRLGVTFEASDTLRHPEHQRLVATPDGVWREGGRVMEVLELKSPGPRTLHEWGEGNDEAPLRYVIQVAQEMAVTGARRGRIGALIDGDLRIYTIHRDHELEQQLIDKVNDFWSRYVETNTPPPVDGSSSAREWLARRYPNSSREMITPDAALVDLVRRLSLVEIAHTDAEKELELLQQQIKERIGSAYGVEVPGIGKCTWSNVKGRTSIDWQAIAKKLGATEEHEAQFTKTGNGHRSFRFWPTKGDK